jgi:phosphoglycolate phosphatase
VPAPYASIRAVGFDLDGTLIDTLPDLATAINAMLLRLGHAALTAAKIRTLVGDGAEPLVERALAAGAGDRGRQVPVSEALGMFKEIYAGQMFRDSRLYPGVIPTLEALRGAGLTLFCVTNKDGALARPLMQESGLEPYLAFTIGTHTREERKPSPAMLLRAATQLGIAPAQMLYVGDSTIDMAAAHAAGCGAVAASYGYDERIRDGAGSPDARISSFSDLTRLGLPAQEREHK